MIKALLTTFISVFVVQFAISQPVNDDPCSATALAVGAACVNISGTNVAATTAAGVPAPGCANYSGGDIWYTVTVPASGNITVTADNNGGFTDGGMAIYSGSCGALTLITCDDDDGPGFHSMIELTGQTPGATLWVMYWEYGNNATGTFDICAIEPPPPAGPPANDDCAGAYPLTVNPDDLCGTTTAGTVDGATASAQSAASCGGTEDDDVWFSFVATGTSHTIDLLNPAGSTTDLYHSVWSGACPALTLVAGTCSDPNSQTVTGLTIGLTYFVRVYTWTSNTGQNSTFDVCIGTPPPPSGNQDCSVSTPVCGNSAFSGNSNGAGTQELNASNSDCLSTEHESSWYTFTIQTTGTLEMTLSPSANDDYDFAIWGPNPSCSPTTTPLRCSYAGGAGAGGSYDTGLGNGAADNSEGGGGDNWVAPINGIAGEVYILLIDNFSTSSNPFDLSWGGTSTLDCSILPISLESFNVNKTERINKLNWQTISEINNDYFTIEKSIDGINYKEIGSVKGNGNSSKVMNYKFDDSEIKTAITYYKLFQIDFDGNKIFIGKTKVKRYINTISIYPNPSISQITFDFDKLKNGSYLIEYINLQGVSISEKIELDNSNIIKSIIFDSLNSGLFLVRISDINGNILEKIKVIKK